MLNQYNNTSPRIPKPSPVPQNQEQYLHVVLHERQIQQQQQYYTSPPLSNISTQFNSPIQNQPKQQINQNDMQRQYHQIMQYYKELEMNMQQQKQENYLKYNEILQKIDNISQIMVYNINQLNINQRNEYQQLLYELQQQRQENQKRYEQLIQNIEQQKDQNHYMNQLQSKQIQQQNYINEQQKSNLSNQYNNIIKPPQLIKYTPINSEQQLIQQDQLNYSQIHNRSNKQSSPQAYISKRNQSQDNNTTGQLITFNQYSPQQYNSNKQLINNQITNPIIQQTKSPRQQISNCINSSNNRDNSISHQKKQIFQKPNFVQVNNQQTFNYNPNNQNNLIIQQQYNSNESIVIDESYNQQELLQQLKVEYGINSLPQNTSLQSISNQLQLIYCISCDQYISLQLSNQHLQVCNSQRHHDSYLDQYIVNKEDNFLIETFETKFIKICKELMRIKQMMQLAQIQKWTTHEYIQLRELCQIANIILDRLLQNPDSSQIIKYYHHIQQIFNVVYMAPQIFYKQQAKLLQKCLDRIKELQLLLKK